MVQPSYIGLGDFRSEVLGKAKIVIIYRGVMRLLMTCLTPPMRVKVGIYLIVEVMTLPPGPIYWVNPHIFRACGGKAKYTPGMRD